MQRVISDYLRSPQNNRRLQGTQDRNFIYLLTYIGELFIQGYRIIQNYGQILLFSLMDFQFSDSISTKTQRKQTKIPPRFKIVRWQMKVQNILGDAKYRREKFNQMSLIGSLLDQVEYNIIYLQEFRYSIVGQQILHNNGLPACLLYFKKITWINYKNGSVPINDKKQGQELHRLIQIFVKGAGEGRNQERIKVLQSKHKFNYNLFKVINTVCYIIGKQMLQNGFQTMTSQKWMRKFSMKNFRRYDLMMRNEQKSMIIDWKFSTKTAMQKARHPKAKKKNALYCQLARKDFKNQIQLRFYSFNRATQNNYYHQFTYANFEEEISTIDLEERIYVDYSEISISDSQSDQDVISYFPVNNVSDQSFNKQQQIKNYPTDCPEGINFIEIGSSEEAQAMEQQVQIISSNQWQILKSNQVGKRLQQINETDNINHRKGSQKTNKKTKAKVSKIQIKKQKREFKQVIRVPLEVLEIQSD